MFINLNTHSYYSLLMSSITIDDIINFAIKNKQKYVSLIDINSMYGTIEFYHKAINNNLIPVIGLQIEYQNEKVILVAKNNNGCKNLFKISSLVMTNRKLDLSQHLADLFVIVNDTSKCSWIKDHESSFSLNRNANDCIACREAFFESKDDIEYIKVLHAIKDGITYKDVGDLSSYR